MARLQADDIAELRVKQTNTVKEDQTEFPQIKSNFTLAPVPELQTQRKKFDMSQTQHIQQQYETPKNFR